MSFYGLAAVATALGLLFGVFLGILACFELGYRFGRSDSRKIHELAYVGTGSIDAALFALLGLLLGFSFAGATSRLESRHELIVREANAIGTAYLRLDLLPPTEQPRVRHLFRDYLDARLQAYERFAHQEATELEFARASELQGQIWSEAITASRPDQSQNSARLLLPALGEMMDAATSRAIAQKIHLPSLVFCLLICIALLSGLLAGYAMSKRQTRSWLHVLIYAAIISITIYSIFDFDNPRFGLIKVDTADTALIQLRDSIR